MINFWMRQVTGRWNVKFEQGETILIDGRTRYCTFNAYIGNEYASIITHKDDGEYIDCVSIKKVHAIGTKRWKNCGSKRKRLIRQQLLKRQENKCAKCGGEEEPNKPVQIHHIIPLSKGGPVFLLSNLELLCAPCHKKHHLKEMEFIYNSTKV